ncbi:MAG TPA: helix-turn-helix domain-containing protein [Gemmatimonadales bacterium]|nr:helix-turn-helix domain-containing protein [Gemmatimonadales bacterium]
MRGEGRIPTSARQGVTALCERLRSRRGEIEAAVLTRVYAVSDPAQVSDPLYREGLRASVSAAVELSLAGIEASERNPPEIPPVLLVQARLAARSGVGLDTVLRRYCAGHTVLTDLLLEESEGLSDADAVEPKRLLRSQTALLERLLATVSEEHRREGESRASGAQRHRLEVARRLLEGEPLDPSELAYGLEGTHVALLIHGKAPSDALPGIARELDRRLLGLEPEEGIIWAWLGGRAPLDPERVRDLLGKRLPGERSCAVGESGEGPSGWRRSHRQAAAALAIALRGKERVVRYADVALLASVAQDELACESLEEMYLAPLRRQRDAGREARRTLRAYFAAKGNVTAAAAQLGVSRNTVRKRVRAIEAGLARPLLSRAAEYEMALKLEELQIGV